MNRQFTACGSFPSSVSRVVRVLAAIAFALQATAAQCASPSTRPSVALTQRPQSDERLSFQTGGTWNPRVNLNCDVAMCYGLTPTLPERIKSYRDRGYTIHVMTGVAWGEYRDYLDGRFDGIKHEEAEGQRQKDGVIRGHGPGVPYMSPGDAYGRYLCVGVKKALDLGAEAIHLEEPEYWANTGWEENFKTQWRAYYNEDWIEPDSTPDAQYRASKLKYYLYRRALATVFEYVRQYNKDSGRNVKCYVPTHSLLNYASWHIVSPESSLMNVGCDGYIAQIWTATGRTPNVYEGRLRERTFETAFLEYGSMQNLVRGTDKRIWYLNDPIEDNLAHPWEEYRHHWESTLVASLLQPEVHRFEVMPWPHRIFENGYPATNPTKENPKPPLKKILPEYETELQAVITAMGNLNQPADQTGWETSGTQGVGVLVADTLMFQRSGPSHSDEHLGHFYGLAMPLVKRGIPVEAVQIETSSLDPYKVLLLTYEGQKPPTEEFHVRLSEWVRRGGVLVVVDDDRDPFNQVREWWNSDGKTFANPRQALFNTFGLAPDVAGSSGFGKGTVIFAKESPTRLSQSANGGDRVRALTRKAIETAGLTWTETNALVMRRGPYVIAAGLEESDEGIPIGKLKGRFIDLYDASQKISPEIELSPGRRTFAIDLGRLSVESEGVVAAASRVTDETIDDHEIRFKADGVDQSHAVVSVRMLAAPTLVQVDGATLSAEDWDYQDNICRIRFINSSEKRDILIRR